MSCSSLAANCCFSTSTSLGGGGAVDELLGELLLDRLGRAVVFGSDVILKSSYVGSRGSVAGDGGGRVGSGGSGGGGARRGTLVSCVWVTP